MNDTNYKGITLPDNSILKIMAYADDTAPYMSDIGDLTCLLKWMGIYEQGTGSKFNLDKSEIIAHQILKPLNCPISNWITQSNQTTKYLGILVGLKPPKDIWDTIITKMETTMKNWNIGGLSLQGKITVIKSYILSMTTYQAMVVHAPRIITQKIEKIFWKFL
jgi:hypothetical protein